MNLLIVTGLSGAGKSLAMHALESVIFSFFGSRPVVSKSRAMYESIILACPS